MKKKRGMYFYFAYFNKVSSWSIDEVFKWLEAIQLEELIHQFKLNHIDGSSLLSLTSDDIKVFELNY